SDLVGPPFELDARAGARRRAADVPEEHVDRGPRELGAPFAVGGLERDVDVGGAERNGSPEERLEALVDQIQHATPTLFSPCSTAVGAPASASARWVILVHRNDSEQVRLG